MLSDPRPSDTIPRHPQRSDRRKARRVELEAEVTIAFGESFFSGSAVDVSRTGIRIASERALLKGQRLALELTLPRGQVLARGTVCWCREGECFGVAFENLSAQDKDILEAYCARRIRATSVS